MDNKIPDNFPGINNEDLEVYAQICRILGSVDVLCRQVQEGLISIDEAIMYSKVTPQEFAAFARVNGYDIR